MKKNIGIFVLVGAFLFVFPLIVVWNLDAILSWASPVLGPRDDASPYLEGEKKLFSDVIKNSSPDFLVAPPRSGHKPIGVVQKELMARWFAQRVGRATGMKVANPTWVMRALGDVSLNFSDQDVISLAKKSGAHYTLTGQFEWANETDRFRLVMTDVKEGRIAFEKQWEILPSTDKPLAVTVAELFNQSMDLWPWPKRVEQRLLSVSTTTALPENPDTLFLPTQDPLQRAMNLQVLASLHAPGRAGQHLWARSLMALQEVSPHVKEAKVLVARAWLHLENRSYALKILGQPETLEEETLWAIAQAHLPLAEEKVKRLTHRGQKLLALLDIEDIRSAFGREENAEIRRESIISQYPHYSFWISRKCSPERWHLREIPEIVQGALGMSGLPKPDRKPPSRLLVLGEAFFDFGRYMIFNRITPRDHFAVAASVQKEIQSRWMKESLGWGKLNEDDGGDPGDKLDLLDEMNRLAVFRDVETAHFRRSSRIETLMTIASLKPAFDGHPWLALTEGQVHQHLALEKKWGSVRWHFLQASRLGYNVNRWLNGEGNDATWARLLMVVRPYTTTDHEGFTKISPKIDPTEVKNRLAENEVKLSHTWFEADLLKAVVDDLTQLSRFDDVEKVLDENKGRFTGSSVVGALVKIAGQGQRSMNREKELREALETDPENWERYTELAQELLAERKFAEARAVFSSYKGFDNNTSGNVRLSNFAEFFGVTLYGAGDVAHALPYFKRSLDYNTGSWCQLRAGTLLSAQLGKWEESLQYTFANYQRYQNFGDAQIAIATLFLLGQSTEAWNFFNELSSRFPDPDLWSGLWIGHRIEAIPVPKLLQWLQDWRGPENLPRGMKEALRDRYAFMALFLDRPVRPEAINAMKTLAMTNPDPAYLRTMTGYTGFLNKDYAAIVSGFSELSHSLTQVGLKRKLVLNFCLPYLAYAHVKLGTEVPFEKGELDDYRKQAGEDFYWLLAKSVIEGLATKDPVSHAKARERLWRAFIFCPSTKESPFFTWYVLDEIAETLFTETGDPAFRDLVLDLARRQVRIYPTFSWTHALIAHYSTHSEEKERGLAAAVFLDPESVRLKDFSVNALRGAKKQSQTKDLFDLKKFPPLEEPDPALFEIRHSKKASAKSMETI